jgi:hypothetical protein
MAAFCLCIFCRASGLVSRSTRVGVAWLRGLGAEDSVVGALTLDGRRPTPLGRARQDQVAGGEAGRVEAPARFAILAVRGAPPWPPGWGGGLLLSGMLGVVGVADLLAARPRPGRRRLPRSAFPGCCRNGCWCGLAAGRLSLPAGGVGREDRGGWKREGLAGLPSRVRPVPAAGRWPAAGGLDCPAGLAGGPEGLGSLPAGAAVFRRGLSVGRSVDGCGGTRGLGRVVVGARVGRWLGWPATGSGSEAAGDGREMRGGRLSRFEFAPFVVG